MPWGPAMTRGDAVRSIEAGIEIVEELFGQGSVDILGTGDIGIGDAALQNKIAVIKNALLVHAPDPRDPIDILSKVGGFEIGGLAGLVIGAAANGIPVVCDGFISTAGALIACELAPSAKAYLFTSHRSVEVGHRYMHERLGIEPLLDLGFRLGEGTGAAIAMELLDAATRILADIKTFDEVAIKNAQI